MRGHIREDEWFDVIAGGGAAEARQHAAACDECRKTYDDVAEGWRLAHDADVPEPSALYWESFRRGVGQKIAQAQPVRRRWIRVYGSAFGAMAAIVLVAF